MRVRSIFLAALSAALLVSGGCGESKQGGKSLRAQAEQARKNPNPDPRARKLAQIALDQFKAGDASGTADTLAEAVHACEEIKDPISRSGTLTYVARVEARSGARAQAVSLLKQAREQADKIPSIEVRASTFAKIGRAEGSELHDVSAAAATLKAAEELAGQIADTKSQAVILVEVAEAYMKAGQSAETQRLLDAALKIAQSIDDPAKRAAALGEVATGQEPLLEKGAPRSAFEAASQAAREVTSDYGRVITMADIAKRLKDARRPAEAEKMLDEAKAVLPKISEVDLQKEADEKIHNVEVHSPAG
jgi:tetratricopeptide (TPR) repeat protein